VGLARRPEGANSRTDFLLADRQNFGEDDTGRVPGVWPLTPKAA
jgi:hypothetical protein